MKKINFVNGQAPALNATNLNQLQTNVEEAINEMAIKSVAADRVLVSDSNGNISVSEITSNELNNLDGVTSNIQTQIDNLNNTKQATIQSGTSLPETATDGQVFILYS